MCVSYPRHQVDKRVASKTETVRFEVHNQVNRVLFASTSHYPSLDSAREAILSNYTCPRVACC